MEEQLIKEFYNDYLSSIFGFDSNHLSEEDLADVLFHPSRYVFEKEEDGLIIKDTVSGLYTGRIPNAKHIYGSYVQGVLEYGIDLYGSKICDIHGKPVDTGYVSVGLVGKKINTLPVVFRKSITGKKKLFFNDVTDSYESAIYNPLFFYVSYDYGPYDDYHVDARIPLESKDYIVFISEDERVFLYRKAIGTYEELNYNKGEKLDSEFNADKNVIKLNDTYYYVTPYEVIDISHLIKNVGWSPKLIANLLVENIIDYSTFKKECYKNKDFYKILKERIKQEKIDKAKKDLDETKRVQEQEKKLRIAKRKKEILLEVKELLGEYAELNKEDSKNNDYMDVDIDIFFIDVDDHKEINPMFINYLSIIDMSGFSFKNVKVSGLNFSNSNALIDPQEVYQKDMSNSLFRGMDFNIADFAGVNIKNSDFTDCIMDFAKLDNAIMDENTVLPKKKEY